MSRSAARPDEMNTQIKADTARWTRIIQDAGIQPQ